MIDLASNAPLLAVAIYFIGMAIGYRLAQLNARSRTIAHIHFSGSGERNDHGN
jgi:hypothetical protein